MRRKAIGRETQAMECPVRDYLEGLPGDMPGASEDDMARVSAYLRAAGLLDDAGIIPFRRVTSNEHKAYDLPVEAIVNQIAFSTPGTACGTWDEMNKAEQPKLEASDRIAAWNEADSRATRAFVSDGRRSLISERPETHIPNGAFTLVGPARRSRIISRFNWHDRQLHAEDAFLMAEYRVTNSPVGASSHWIIQSLMSLFLQEAQRDVRTFRRRSADLLSNLNAASEPSEHRPQRALDAAGSMPPSCVCDDDRTHFCALLLFSRVHSCWCPSDSTSIRHASMQLQPVLTLTCAVQNPDSFIRFFTMLAKATPEQLGWDESIRRVVDEKEVQYQLKVGDDWFQTTRRIADLRANDVVGRATRV
jgi:hypothetical protein